MLKPKYVVVILSILFASAVAATEIYKWTDENGVVHYSDTPGSSTSQVVDITPPAEVSSSPAATSPTSPTAATSSMPQPTAEEKQQVALQQKQIEAFCQQAKNNVTLLQETGRRLYIVEPNGQYHWYTDEERKQALAKTQAEVQQYCQPTSGTPSSNMSGNTAP